MRTINKSLLLALCVVFLSSYSLEAFSKRIKKYYYVVNIPVNDVLNIRKYPSVKSKKIGGLDRGQECVWVNSSKINKGGHKWYKVSFYGTEGWVSGAYMRPEKPGYCR